MNEKYALRTNQNIAHENQSENVFEFWSFFVKQTVSKIYIQATKSGLFYET